MSRAEFGIARTAIRQIVVLVVVGVIVVDKPTAILAGCVVVFVATVAKRNELVAFRVIVPYSVGTAITDRGVLFQTVIAKYLLVKIVVLSLRDACTADGTNDFLAHKNFSFEFILNFCKEIIYNLKSLTCVVLRKPKRSDKNLFKTKHNSLLAKLERNKIHF
jgi:hypothetical protein